MSTRLLYQAFGSPGCERVNFTCQEGQVKFTLRHKRASDRCSACRRWNVIRHGEEVRTFRTVSIGSKAVLLEAAIPRVECRACGAIRQVRLSFAEPRYVLELSQAMTIQDVARHLDVGWDTTKPSGRWRRRSSKARAGCCSRTPRTWTPNTTSRSGWPRR